MYGGWKLDKKHKIHMGIGIAVGIACGIGFKKSFLVTALFGLSGAVIGIISAGGAE